MNRLLLETLRASPAPMQLVVIAAGVDPMSLEILSLAEGKIAHVYELDKAFMDEKKKRDKRISCIPMDITSPQLMDDLIIQYAFDPVLPTFLQMEDITHYMMPQDIQRLLEQFASGCSRNRVLAGFHEVSQCSINDFRRMLTQVGGVVIDHQTSYDLEGLRTGHHTIIPQPEDGLVDVMLGKL